MSQQKPTVGRIVHYVADDDGTTNIGGIAGKSLRVFIERVERLEEEKAALADDIKEVYAEAKGVGFCAKTMRVIVRLRKIDIEKRREAEEMLDLYKAALGMDDYSNTPLGQFSDRSTADDER